MSPILTGVIASGISGHLTPPWSPEGAYDSLATVTLSTATASIEFAGIPSGYKHLQIRFIARSDYAGYADGIKFQFNGDTGSNYSDHSLYGNGSSAGSSADVSAAYIRTYQIAAANSVTNAFGGGFIDILDYADVSKYKTSRMLTAFDNNYAGGGGEINLTSGLWMSTSAITSIKFMVTNGTNFAQYSQFYLFGVK